MAGQGRLPAQLPVFERLNSNDLRDRLQSAFDMSQMFSIFQHLISVIDEQALEHGRLSSQLRQLQDRVAEQEALPERLATLAAVVKDLEEELGSVRDTVNEPARPPTRPPAVMVVEDETGGNVALLVRPDVRPEPPGGVAPTGTHSPGGREASLSPLGSAGRLQSLQNLLVGGRRRPLQGEVSDGQGTSLVPLEMFEAFAVVRTDEDRQAVEDLLGASQELQEKLFADLVRRDCIVRNVQRFKPALDHSHSSVMDRVAELERSVAEHAQSLSEQRAQARGLPVFLEAVNAQLAKLQEDRRQQRHLDEELADKLREEVLRDVAEAELRREENRLTELSRRLVSREEVDRAMSSRDAALAEDLRELREALDEERRRSREMETAIRELKGALGAKGDWRNELESLAYTVNLLSAQQVNATRALMDDVSKLQGQMEHAPDESSVREMWHEYERDLSRRVAGFVCAV